MLKSDHKKNNNTQHIHSWDTGIGHLTKNYLRPIYLLPKKTSFRKVQLLVQRLINNYEIEREVIQPLSPFQQ